MAAEAVEAGLMAVEAVASMVAAGLMAVADIVAADLMAVGDIVVAGMAARGLMVAEEVAPQAAGLKRAAIPVRPEIGHRRIIVPQSTMASGIRSATPVVPLVPRVWAKDAIPEARRTQASRPVMSEVPWAVGTLLARRAALRQEARQVLPAEPPEVRRALVDVALAGVDLASATVLAAATVGDGEDGASDGDGRTGDLAGDSAGLPGGTTLIGMHRGRRTATRTIRITGTTGPTIRRIVWIRRRICRRMHMTTTCREAV